MSKRNLLVTLIITALVLGLALFSFKPKEDVMNFIALDNANGHHLPKKFRLMDYKLLQGVHASASGQFSPQELKYLLKYIKKHAPNTRKTWIIDLRQESHGFINDRPVTWYKYRNQGNLGKSASEIFLLERKLLKDITVGKPIDLFELTKGKDGQVFPGTKHTVIVEKAQTEEELVQAHNVAYLRFYTLDHNEPKEYDVDRFIEFVRTQVQPGDWLHFHCRGGRGRTSTYLTLLFIMFNAQHMDLDYILRYQQQIGSIDLAKMYSEEHKLWKNDSANSRYNFIQDFYRFVKDPQGLGHQAWSTWIAQQSTNQAK